MVRTATFAASLGALVMIGIAAATAFAGGAAAMTNVAAATTVQAITVPAIPGNPDAPHVTYSGATVTLKGIARNGATQYMWSFGDGTAAMPWTAITNPYDLALTHVYNGFVGQLFVATLSVKDASGHVATAGYPIKIMQSSDLSDPAQLDVRAQMASENALWFLHVNEVRTALGAVSPYYGQSVGYWNVDTSFLSVPTCDAIDAFEQAGNLPQGDYDTDPYVEDVQRGLAFVLANTTTATLGFNYSVNATPDVNGNGIGVTFNANVTQDASCVLALADSRAANVVASTGPANVYGRTYASIAQDAVEWLAATENTGPASGAFRGAWGYGTSGGIDTDPGALFWPVAALRAAETKLGATVPAYVRQELAYWLAYSRHSAADVSNGAWGSYDGNAYLYFGTTVAGVAGELFAGKTTLSTEVQQGLGFLYRNWNVVGSYAPWDASLGSTERMFTLAETMADQHLSRVFAYDYTNGAQSANSADWYYTPAGQQQQGYATNLVQRQNTNGSFADAADHAVAGVVTTTAEAATILGKGSAVVANAGGPYTTDVNRPVTFDASGSWSRDGAALTYEWDFDYDGTTFDVDATGATVTDASGFATYSAQSNGAPLAGVAPHQVAVRVRDANGEQVIAVTNVVVKPAPHAPVPILAPVAGPVGVPVTFDASASYDVDNDPLTYAWDFGSGGFTDATGATTTRTFSAPGTYVACVQVTDQPAGGPSASTRTCEFVKIGAGANPAPPVCQIVTPNVVVSNSGGTQSVTLDGSRSYDASGLPLTYSWTTTGGVTIDNPAAAVVKETGNFAGAGADTSWTSTLTVDNGSFKSSCNATVTVLDDLPPALTVPADVTLEANANTDAAVLAWLSSATATDPAASPGTHVPLTNDFVPGPGLAGIGVGNTVKVTWSAQNPYDATKTAQRSATVSVVDTTPPALTLPDDITASGAVVTYTASASDFVSGSVPVTCDHASGSTFPGGTTTVTCTATDGAGNTATGSFRVTVADATPPVITPTVSGTQGDNGWYTSDVQLSWSVADLESPVSAQSGCDDVSVTTDTNGTDFTCSVTSAGGTSTQTISIKRDTQPPTISDAETPAANPAGWNDSDVTATFTCKDGGSGIARCPDPVTFGEGTAQSATATVKDRAGNTATDTVRGINVDKTPPELVGKPTTAPNANGWYDGDVTIRWTCADSGGSGIDGACPSDDVISGEGTGLTATASVADVAGNVTVAKNAAVRIDRTPPVTEASAPSGWSNTGVTVTLSATDNLSGVATTFWKLDGGATQTGTSADIADEGAHTLVYWSVEAAGNIEQQRSIRVLIDQSAPTITHTQTPAANLAGWNKENVTVSFLCDDPLSGIAFCTPDQLLTTEGAAQPVLGKATDNAGNSAQETARISIDKTPPTITAAADRAPNANGWYKDDVLVAFTCGDTLSGVVACPAPVRLGEGRAQSVTRATSDAAGNAATATLSAVDVDETAPVVAFTGSGAYTVDQTIAITCAATDALSGVESSTCADLSAPAWSFGLGTTSRTATAVDRAGNTGTGSVSFTVGVTCASLKTLVARWVSAPDVATSLESKIDAICSAGTATSKSGKLGAFDNQVDAQTGKAIGVDRAPLLKQFAATL